MSVQISVCRNVHHAKKCVCTKTENMHSINSQFILGFLRITMLSREIIIWLSFHINDYVCQSGRTTFNWFGKGEVFIPTVLNYFIKS